MSKVLEVTGAEQITGHPHSLALTGPDRVTFVKAASREDARWWAELLAVFPRRHKRNATFPGGRASPSLPQLGRSASPQPPRPRHLSCIGPSPRANFTTPPLKEEREATANTKISSKREAPISGWVREPATNWRIQPPPPPRTGIFIKNKNLDFFSCSKEKSQITTYLLFKRLVFFKKKKFENVYFLKLFVRCRNCLQTFVYHISFQ